jgi:hypothetical protein
MLESHYFKKTLDKTPSGVYICYITKPKEPTMRQDNYLLKRINSTEKEMKISFAITVAIGSVLFYSLNFIIAVFG